ncbi:hypothetical protein BC831DRAFT_441618 [Entophlyctis helioformis]|nr:hypothetical protein BC831DRAFT_441618 [Entophlyctis helioformis]
MRTLSANSLAKGPVGDSHEQAAGGAAGGVNSSVRSSTLGGAAPSDTAASVTLSKNNIPLDTTRIYRVGPSDDASSTGRQSPAGTLSKAALNAKKGSIREKVSSTEALKQGGKSKNSSRKMLASIGVVQAVDASNGTPMVARAAGEMVAEPEDYSPSQGSGATSAKARSPDGKAKGGSIGKVRLSPIDGANLNKQVLTSRARINTEPLEMEPCKLSIESTLQDFRIFQSAMRHPGALLGLIAKEDDKEVHSEFDDLCNELLIVLGELEASLEDITLWKDDFLKQSVPSAVKLELTLLFAKLFRSKSDLHQPLFELIKSVRLFSRPWREKRHALLELESEYQRHYHVLDIAIRKLDNMQAQVKKIRTHHRIGLWERLIQKLIDYEGTEGDDGQYAPQQRGRSRTPSLLPAASPSPAGRPESGRRSPARLGDDVANQAAMSASMSANLLLSSSRSMSASLLKLKSTIQSYIVDEPEWRKNARTLVKRFKSLVRKNHPGLKKIMPQILQRPLPGPSPRLQYLSTKTSTIVIRKRPFPIPRAISCHNFRELADYQQEMDSLREQEEARSLSKSRGPQVDEFGLEIENAAPDADLGDLTSLRMSNPLLRSNSYNTLSELGKRAQLKHPLIKGRTEYDPDTYEVDFEDEYDSDEMLSEDDDASDDYSDIDEKYFKRFHQEDIQEVISSFFDTHPNKEREMQADGKPQEEDVTQHIDTDKEFFTIQEVIELTLLHAQQMHILQSEYSERIARMAGQIEELHQEQVDLNNEWEKRYQQAVDRAQKMTVQTIYQGTGTSGGVGGSAADDLAVVASPEQSLLSSPVARRKPSRLSVGAGHAETASRAKRAMLHQQQQMQTAETQEDDSPSSKLAKLKERIERRRQAAIQKGQRMAKPKKRVLPPRKLPKFSSTPMAMSFMERLRWFTEMSLRKRAESRNAVVQMEMTANEQRLAHIRRIQNDEAATSITGALSEKSALMAEFMPMPGTVPTPKVHRDVWAEQGILSPWGGRFKTTTSPLSLSTKKINVLNLFDVAMNIPPSSPHSQPQADTRNDPTTE